MDGFVKKIDTLINCTMPLMKNFGIEGEFTAKVLKRGFRPMGLSIKSKTTIKIITKNNNKIRRR